LNSIDKPIEPEFEIISQFDKQGEGFHLFFRSAVLFSHAWFDLLNEKKWIRKQIDCEAHKRADVVFWWLQNIAGERPGEVTRLLRSWWGGDQERAERLLNWFGFVKRSKPDDDLFYLCDEIINSHPNSLFQEQGRDRIRMLLYKLGKKVPDRSGQILHSLFNAWFALNPGRNLFEYDGLKSIDSSSLNEIAEKAPQAFLNGTTDALSRSIDMVVEKGKKGKNWYRFNYRSYSGRRYGFDGFLGMYRSALKKVVQETPKIAIIYLEKLDPHKHQCLMHLHLEAIQANPTVFGKRLPPFVINKMVFDAGWNGANWLSFAHACRKALPHLCPEEKQRIENAIFDHTPEIDRAIRIIKENNPKVDAESVRIKNSVIHYLNRSKYEQWCVLETIGEILLSPVAQSRLYELRRKFRKTKNGEPSHTEAYSVGSPIKRVHCDRMKDSHWLSAIERYDSNENRRYGRDFIDGGARQLAQELQAATKKKS
jgi:hypothetical protein